MEMSRVVVVLALLLAGCAGHRAPLPDDLPTGAVSVYLTHSDGPLQPLQYARVDGLAGGDKLWVRADDLGGDAWWWDYCQVGRVLYDTTRAERSGRWLVLRAEAVLR
jgi:hypothetical protein